MTLFEKLRKTLRSSLLGSAGRSHILDLPILAPQNQVTVWLYGLGEPQDVTVRHSVACAAPFTLCIGFARDVIQPISRHTLALRFYDHAKTLLGEIRLRPLFDISTSGPTLRLYKAISCTHHRLHPFHRATRALYSAYDRWKARKKAAVSVSSLDVRCNEIIFICPRPTVLVSLFQQDSGNIFPMNLMGAITPGYFGFALNSKRQAPTVEKFAQLALSTIPFEYAEQVRQLGKNHHRSTIDLNQLPFPTQLSPTLYVPIPSFALSVRELKIESAHPLGSHTFFVATILHKHDYKIAPEFHRINIPPTQ